MTESMPTTRLSLVMTACGGKPTTCSRMSILLRTWSTTGTSRWMPGSSVRLYLPSRSMTKTDACGTIRTVLNRMTATRPATTQEDDGRESSTGSLSRGD